MILGINVVVILILNCSVRKHIILPRKRIGGSRAGGSIGALAYSFLF